MLWFFKRKKKDDTSMNTVNTATPSNKINPLVLKKVKIPRKFEIYVEEFDEEKGWKPVVSANIPGALNSNPVITVNSPSDLQEKVNLYKSMEQRFRIVREIDPPSKETIYQLAIQQGINPETGDQLSADQIANFDKKQQTEENVQRENNKDRLEKPVEKTVHENTNIVNSNNGIIKNKAKIVTIGDIQIKYDGDKVYQKQWMRLTDAEMSNLRLVSDSNNKLISLHGKHIEMKKWVLVEENNIEENDIMENITND